MSREDTMRRLGYGPAWDASGVIDDRLLDEQARSADADSPEHVRWAMFLAFARSEVRWDRPLASETLERLLALDLAEASAPPPNLGHAIARYVSQFAGLESAQLERLAEHPIAADERRAFEEHLLERVIEGETTRRWRAERPRSREIRRASRTQRPSEILSAHRWAWELEAMLELSSAWDAPLGELRAARAFVRGEIDAAAVDAALDPVRLRHEPSWSLALEIGDALERDVVDRALVSRLERAPDLVIRWLLRLSGLSIAALKHAIDEIRGLGDALDQPGTLSAVLTRARARADRSSAEAR